jgi:signal transduction histidine kinase
VPVYTVAAYCDRRASLAALAAVGVAMAALPFTSGGTEVTTWIGTAPVVAAAWLLGRFVGDRRTYAARLEARTAELERAREELARRAVAEERLRIAQELHDVVAHSVSVIAVQSGVGAVVADGQPGEARKALAAIEGTSRAALEELRRLLGVLRHDDEPQGSLAPLPGLADLDGLLAEAAKAGLAVGLRVEGIRPQVPPGVDLSAYRIVQEALTNVVKHAGPAQAQVVVRYGDQEVTTEVTDDGRGAAALAGAGRAGSGHGLIGMGERVALFDGDLEVGPRPAGGFGSPPGCALRQAGDDDPGGGRRRPGPGPWRVPGAGRLRARPRGGRRGRRRRPGGRAGLPGAGGARPGGQGPVQRRARRAAGGQPGPPPRSM